MRYRAFLSYSRHDERIANWLHRQLDSYRVPKPLVGLAGAFGAVPATLHPIFRDRTDMSGGGALSARIEDALRESEALVVLCSPAAAASPWVNREVELFLALGRLDRIFPVIVADLPDTDDIERDFFPPALHGRGLLAADLREIKQKSGRLVGDGREGGRLKVVAGLLGVALDEIAKREHVRRRRQRIQAVAVSGVLLVAIAAAVTLGLQLSAQSRIAAAQRLAKQAEAIRIQEPLKVEVAVLIALEAYKRTPIAETLAELSAGLRMLPQRLAYMPHGEEGLIARAEFTRDGRYIASVGRDRSARLWRSPTGENVFVSHYADVVLSMALSRDGRLLATGSGDLFCDWTDSPLAPKDNTARVLSIPAGEVVREVKHESSVLAVDLSTDGTLLLTGSCDATAGLWEIASGRRALTLRHDKPISDVTFSPDGTRAATGGQDGFAKIWDVRTGEELRRFDHRRDRWVERVRFSPDGSLLAIGTVGTNVYLWNTLTGEQHARMAHANRAHSVTFSPNGAYLATLSYDKSINVWEVKSGRIVSRLVERGEIYNVAFSPDGRYLAAGVHAPVASVWDWEANRRVAILTKSGPISRVSFSPDGTLLVTGGHEDDPGIRLWRLPHAAPIDAQGIEAEACARLRRNLTPEEWTAAFGAEPYRKTCPALP